MENQKSLVSLKIRPARQPVKIADFFRGVKHLNLVVVFLQWARLNEAFRLNSWEILRLCRRTRKV